MTKAKRTYRLEQETLDRLAGIAEAEGITATEALERAILAYGSEPDASHTDGQTLSEADAKAVDALAAELERLGEQLDRKDRQIEQLGDALADAQATAKGAQALHAATAQTLALESAEQKKSLWRRLTEALRG
jgi:transposase